jgi:aspartate aminotransferase
MTAQPISRQMASLLTSLAPLIDYFTASTWARRRGESGILSFVTGTPQELPPPAFVEALQRACVPRNPQWFAYKQSEPGARTTVAAALHTRLGVPFEPEDIFLTNGAFAALPVVFRTLADPGDEIIFISPPWFYYEAMIRGAGAKPVRVVAPPPTCDLDLARSRLRSRRAPARSLSTRRTTPVGASIHPTLSGAWRPC